MRILLIEDNDKLAERLERRLTQEGFQVQVVHQGIQGEALALHESFDVLIVDLMLPDHDGRQICANLRKRKVTTPILILTVLSETKDKVDGLEAGADDYLTKPFDPDELVARIRALSRRCGDAQNNTLCFEDLRMDLIRRTVARGDKPVNLTSKEFALLEYFLRHPERVVTRSAIGENVWDMNFEEESNVIEVYVSRLRRKVDKGFDKRLIHTVTGTGYVLSATRTMLQA